MIATRSHARPYPEPPLPPLAERNMAAVMRTRVAQMRDKVAVRDLERALTYQELLQKALQVAGGVAALGIARQQPVLVMLNNHLDMVGCVVGLGISARVQVCVNAAYRGEILTHVINNSGARVMIIEASHAERLNEIADFLAHLQVVVVRGECGGFKLPARIRVLRFHEIGGESGEIVPTLPSDVYGIMYTSGTTGLSKGALVSHAHAYSYASPCVYAGAVDITHEDVNLVVLPLFHAAGQWAGLYNTLIAGATAVIPPHFSASNFWHQVREFQCTYAGALGTIAEFLLNQPPRLDDRNHRLRKFGMSPVIPQVKAFMERFGIEAVSTGYGSTEMGCIASAPFGTAVPGEAGWIRDGYEVRLVDDQDLDVPPGEAGEILVRQKEPWCVFLGYHGMPEATVSAWRNLWFHTGDRGRFAPDGQLIFLDRNNDAIRRRGENISSFEVEREICRHPAILEAAAVAVPGIGDDEIKACVVIRGEATLTPAELRDFLESRLPRFMVPRYIEILPRLPKTPTEKVRKKPLRESGVSATTWDAEAPGRG
jgi:crotonobetaine/carnitine-CoA ligase